MGIMAKGSGKTDTCEVLPSSVVFVFSGGGPECDSLLPCCLKQNMS